MNLITDLMKKVRVESACVLTSVKAVFDVFYHSWNRLHQVVEAPLKYIRP